MADPDAVVDGFHAPCRPPATTNTLTASPAPAVAQRVCAVFLPAVSSAIWRSDLPPTAGRRRGGDHPRAPVSDGEGGLCGRRRGEPAVHSLRSVARPSPRSCPSTWRGEVGGWLSGAEQCLIGYARQSLSCIVDHESRCRAELPCVLVCRAVNVRAACPSPYHCWIEAQHTVNNHEHE